MARINIEDSLWSDPRFLKLCIKLGDELRAVGAIVLAWRVAQKHWCPDRQPIPRDDFERAGLPETLIEVGLAERVGESVRMRGSDEHFAWWFQRQDAGRKGGEANAKRIKAAAKRPVSGEKQIEPSSSSSSSSSSSFSNSSSSSKKELAISEKSPTGLNPVKVYCDQFKAKYGKSPDIRGKESGQLVGLVKDLGLNRTLEVIRVYFSMPDPYFVKRGHDISTLLLNLNKISQFEGSGKIVTSAAVAEIEKQVDKIQGTRRRRTIDEIQAEQEAQTLLAGGIDAD